MNPNANLISYRYELRDKIGEGGMGVVYRALDRLTDTLVALKSVTVFHKTGTFAPDKNFHQTQLALAHEFQIMAGLRHPHILSVLDYGFDHNGVPFFTMPFLVGARDLTEATAEYDTTGKIQTLVSLLEALIYLHQHGIVHRDLKPANVVLLPEEGVKVLDFGIATTDHTSESIAGTLLYMAPEIFMGEAASPAADLYAVGVIAFEMFTGRLPFEGTELSEIINDALYGIPPLDLLPPASGITNFIGRLLSKDPLDRYRSAAYALNELLAETHFQRRESLEVRESFLQAAHFIGRERELAQLMDALDRNMMGRGSAWLIGGESGVGKTRLLEEVRTRAMVGGALVLRGQAVEGGGRRYELWRTVLPRLVIATEMTDLEAGILYEVVPHIGQLLGRPITPAAPLAGAGQQQRLSSAIVNLFEQQSQPLVLLLEDLQWTSESLEILKDLLPIIQMQPLMIIGTYRNDEMPHLPEQLPLMREIPLARLTETEIAHLTVAMVGESGQQAHVVDFLMRETEGNVFFLVEVMRALAEDAGTLNRVGVKMLPEEVFTGGIERLVERRIQQLPAWAREMLYTAAVAGRRLDMPLLQYLQAQNAPLLTETLDDWLHTCADVYILNVQDNEWQFSHDKIRAYVLQTIAPQTLPALHAQVANAIEQLYPDDAAHVDILMQHWRAANNTDKELLYLNRVVERLMWVTADYPAAQTLIQRGISLLPKDDKRRLNLLNHWSESYWRMGNFDEGKKIAYRALRFGKKVDAPVDLGRCLGNIGIIARLQGENAIAQKYLMRSLRLRQKIGDEVGISRSLSNLGINAYVQGNYAQARRYYQRSLKLQKRLGDTGGVILNLMNIGETLAEEGSHTEAERYMQRSLKLARKVDNRYAIAASLNNLGINAFLLEKLEVALAYFNESMHIFWQTKNNYGVVFNQTYLVNLLPADTIEFAMMLAKGLEQSVTMRLTKITLQMLVGAARYWLAQGNFMGAMALVGFIKQHPITEQDKVLQGFLKRWDAHLAEQFPPTLIAAGMAQPLEGELETVVQQILTTLNE